jgi:hypothetical protein
MKGSSNSFQFDQERGQVHLFRTKEKGEAHKIAHAIPKRNVITPNISRQHFIVMKSGFMENFPS